MTFWLVEKFKLCGTRRLTEIRARAYTHQKCLLLIIAPVHNEQIVSWHIGYRLFISALANICGVVANWKTFTFCINFDQVNAVEWLTHPWKRVYFCIGNEHFFPIEICVESKCCTIEPKNIIFRYSVISSWYFLNNHLHFVVLFSHILPSVNQIIEKLSWK